jgi:hypothetical protein
LSRTKIGIDRNLELDCFSSLVMVRYPNQLLHFWIIYNTYVLWTGEVARRAIWRQMEV